MALNIDDHPGGWSFTDRKCTYFKIIRQDDPTLPKIGVYMGENGEWIGVQDITSSTDATNTTKIYFPIQFMYIYYVNVILVSGRARFGSETLDKLVRNVCISQVTTSYIDLYLPSTPSSIGESKYKVYYIAIGQVN